MNYRDASRHDCGSTRYKPISCQGAPAKRRDSTYNYFATTVVQTSSVWWMECHQPSAITSRSECGSRSEHNKPKNASAAFARTAHAARQLHWHCNIALHMSANRWLSTKTELFNWIQVHRSGNYASVCRGIALYCPTGNTQDARFLVYCRHRTLLVLGRWMSNKIERKSIIYLSINCSNYLQKVLKFEDPYCTDTKYWFDLMLAW